MTTSFKNKNKERKTMSKNVASEKIGMIFNPLTGENMSEKRNTINKTPFKIFDYVKKENVTVQFLDEHGYIAENMDMRNLKRNSIKNPFEITVYGKGYLGADFKKYPTREDNKDSITYKKWIDMIRRCYDEKSLQKRPSYRECEVYKKWLNYSEFAKWMKKRYYTLDGQIMHLDKDILYKNNKLYSPKRCVIVPGTINDLIVIPVLTDLPIGIRKEISGSYSARVRFNSLGYNIYQEKRFNTIKGAMRYYEREKKKVIILCANYFKDAFIKEYGRDAFNHNDFKFKTLYNALLNYKVY